MDSKSNCPLKFNTVCRVEESLKVMEANCRSHSVPLDIYSLILSYLPVKSLLRFRSICKEWKSIIGSGDFASLHLSQYANNRLGSRVIELELCNDLSSLWLNGFDVSQFYGQTLEFDFSRLSEALTSSHFSSMLVGGINGLILLVLQSPDNLRHGDLILWNPSIRKVLNIPLPPSSKSQVVVDFWLGFDPSTNDYKVVSMARSYNRCNTSFEIFSLRSHSWRSKGDLCCQFHCTVHSLSWGRSVHWLLLKSSSSNGDPPLYKKDLLSFDMTTETISQTPLPYMVYKPCMNRVDLLIAMTESLIGLLTSCDGTTEIWALDKDECWSKRFKFDASIDNIWLYLEKDGWLIWTRDNFDDYGDYEATTVFASDLITGKTSVISWHHQLSPFYIGTYIESLALLN